MSVLLLLRVCLLLLLGECVSTFAIRDTSFNSTTVSSETLIASPTSFKTASSWAGKVHGESSVTGFDSTADAGKPKETRVKGGDDVGSIIASEVGADPTGISEEWPTGASDAQRAHHESTAVGWEGGVTDAQPQQTAHTRVVGNPKISVPPVTNNGQTLTPVPATSVVIGSQTLTPGGETVTVGDGDSATKIHLDESGKPVVVVGDKTSTAQIAPSTTVIDGQTLAPGGSPITVGSGSEATTYSINPAGETIAIANGATSTMASSATQVFTIGEITATAEATGYQYLIDSSILAIGHPVTVSGTVMSLTTDASGSTVLVAGDSSTTLAPPITDAAHGLGIATTVIDGTTQYVIDSQTLAPGHPITVDGTAVSISTSAGTTVLVVGDKTTTLSGPSASGSDGGLTTDVAVATPGSSGGGGATAATSKKGGAQRVERWDAGASCAMALVIAVLGLG